MSDERKQRARMLALTDQALSILRGSDLENNVRESVERVGQERLTFFLAAILDADGPEDIPPTQWESVTHYAAYGVLAALDKYGK